MSHCPDSTVDPVQDAIASAIALIEKQGADGLSRDQRSDRGDALGRLKYAETARAYERREGRLVRPEDRW